LYGKCFRKEKEEGKEYVIREGSTKLGQMLDNLINQYKSRFNGEVGSNGKQIGEPVIVRELGDVKLGPEDEDTPHIQIISVKPYFDDEERERRKTEFMKRTMLNVFYYDIQISGENLKEELRKARKSQDGFSMAESFEKTKNENSNGSRNPPGMHEIGLKRIIFRTSQTFPSYVRRLLVIPESKRVLILTPVQMNLLDMERRIEELKNCIDPIYEDKAFMPKIQGSIATQVCTFSLEIRL
jgi:hypothetical protein